MYWLIDEQHHPILGFVHLFTDLERESRKRADQTTRFNRGKIIFKYMLRTHENVI